LSKAEDSSIKVIDFGVSAIFSNEPINVRKVKDKKIMTTKTGTVKKYIMNYLFSRIICPLRFF
jgi:hypothetical protein